MYSYNLPTGSNYDSGYLRKEPFLWHMHQSHTFHPLCAHLRGASQKNNQATLHRNTLLCILLTCHETNLHQLN